MSRLITLFLNYIWRDKRLTHKLGLHLAFLWEPAGPMNKDWKDNLAVIFDANLKLFM